MCKQDTGYDKRRRTNPTELCITQINADLDGAYLLGLGTLSPRAISTPAQVQVPKISTFPGVENVALALS